jgi:deoxyribodipyrimidine photolyase-like uncharacterized protein
MRRSAPTNATPSTPAALLHHEDAALAVTEYLSRHPLDPSDVPVEAAMNHAAAALRVAGFTVQERSLARQAWWSAFERTLQNRRPTSFQRSGRDGARTRINSENFQVMYDIEMHTASEEFARCYQADRSLAKRMRLMRCPSSNTL